MSRLPVDPSAHWQSQLDCAALLRQYGAVRRICERALAWLGDGPSTWLFWRCWSRVSEGESASAVSDLRTLASIADFSLAATALLIQATRHAKVKDKDVLAALKSQLRALSQSASPAGLLLAARYFLVSGKPTRARQCIEQRVKADRDNPELLALFGWIDLRDAAAGEAEATERETRVERATNVFRKAIRIGTGQKAAAAQSDAHTAAASSTAAIAAAASSSPSLLVAYLGRVTLHQSTGQLVKARRDLEQLTAWFPIYLPAHEWRASVLAATQEWQECIDLCQAQLARIEEAGATPPTPTRSIETDSVRLRWLIALHALLHAPSLRGPSVCSALSAFSSVALRLEGRNVPLLSSSAHTLIALCRGDSASIDVALTLLDKAMYVQRQAFPVSAHEVASRLLAIQGLARLAQIDPTEALECFLESFVFDESSVQPVLGQIQALILLRRGEEAKKLLATLPDSSRSSIATAHASSPTSADFHARVLRAMLAWQHSSDAEGAFTHLTDALDVLMAMQRHTDRAAPADEAVSGTCSNLLDPEFYPRLHTDLLVTVAQLYLDVLGDGWKDSRLTAEETRELSLLQPMIAILARLSARMPGDMRLVVYLAQLSLIARDLQGCEKYLQRGRAMQQVASSDSPREAPPVFQAELTEIAGLLKSHRTLSEKKEDARASTPGPSLESAPLFIASAPGSRPPSSKLRRSRRSATPVSAVDDDLAMAPMDVEALINLDDDAVSAPAIPSRAKATDAQEATAAKDRARQAELRRRAEEDAQDALDVRRRSVSTHLSLSLSPNPSAGALLTQAHQLHHGSHSNSDSSLHAMSRNSSTASLNSSNTLAAAAHLTHLLHSSDSNKSVGFHLASSDSNKSVGFGARTMVGSDSNRSFHLGSSDSNKSVGFARTLVASDSGRSVGATREPSPATSMAQLHAHTPAATASAAAVAASFAAASAPKPSDAPLKSASHTPQTSARSRQPSNALAPTFAASSAPSLAFHPTPAPTPSTAASSSASGPAFIHPGASPPSSSRISSSLTPRTDSRAVTPRTGTHRSAEATALLERKAQAAVRVAEIESVNAFLALAKHGSTFWKHGRSGAPHERLVRLEIVPVSPTHGGELRFDWSSDRMSVARDEFRLLLGKQSDVFQRDTARRSKPDLCFSVAGLRGSRTLDLECRNKDLRAQWVDGLTKLMHHFPGSNSSPSHAQTPGAGGGWVGGGGGASLTHSAASTPSGGNDITGAASSFLGVKQGAGGGSGGSVLRPTPPSTQR